MKNDLNILRGQSHDDAGSLTSVVDTVSSSHLGGTYTWNADGTLATMPGPGYTRHLSYDEERRMTGIAKEENEVHTPVLEFGYGYDGGRRYRHDLVEDVIDWFPCGVACCAGELITLSSADGGDTWQTKETRLYGSGNLLIDSSAILAAIGPGTAVTSGSGSQPIILDSKGVVRSGTVGVTLDSALSLQLEYTQLYVQLQAGGIAPHEWTIDRCQTAYGLWTNQCNSNRDGCLAAFGVSAAAAIACIAACGVPIPDPISKGICAACIILLGGSLAGILACLEVHRRCLSDAATWYNERCLPRAQRNKINSWHEFTVRN